MTSDKLPKYAILSRLGTFCLDVVGRAQIITVATVFAALIGARLFFVHF